MCVCVQSKVKGQRRARLSLPILALHYCCPVMMTETLATVGQVVCLGCSLDDDDDDQGARAQHANESESWKVKWAQNLKRIISSPFFSSLSVGLAIIVRVCNTRNTKKRKKKRKSELAIKNRMMMHKHRAIRQASPIQARSLISQMTD